MKRIIAWLKFKQTEVWSMAFKSFITKQNRYCFWHRKKKKVTEQNICSDKLLPNWVDTAFDIAKINKTYDLRLWIFGNVLI